MNIYKERISHLRSWMLEEGVSACIIPQSDPHKSEYIEAHYELRTFFSGFDGSAGSLVVTKERAGLWTDSRYYIQAEEQLQGSGIDLFKDGLTETPSYTCWLQDQVAEEKVAANAYLFSANEWSVLSSKLNLCHLPSFELLYANRPSLSSSKAFLHEEKYSGESLREKLSRVRVALKEHSVTTYLITSLDDIAWLLNVRAHDVQHNPVLRSYVLLNDDACFLYVDESKIGADVKAYFTINKIKVKPYDSLAADLALLSVDRILLDKAQVNFALCNELPLALTVDDVASLVAPLRAHKNKVEIEGYRQSMLKDGLVWLRLLKWFRERLETKEELTEALVADKLLQLKSKQALFVEESFGTIAGYGAHGAIGHYSVTPETDAKIDASGFLVIDTGTNYLNGTTDTTRTLACGVLSEQQKRDYTLVLKGHIALSSVQFPEGTKGSQLDILARQFLWKAGLNYGHGTGHGVGHLLNVHEGYAWLRPRENGIVYEPGMTMTNEPGMYRKGSHGVRIENVLLVKESILTDFGRFFDFEDLTLVPLELRAIELELLNKEEIAWINAYHLNLRQKLAPLLSAEEIIFLNKETYEI